MGNNVNHPGHYNVCGLQDTDGSAKYEAIKIIEDWGMGFCLGNALKYICRSGHKGDMELEDLQKALWYIDRACRYPESIGLIYGRAFTIDEVCVAWGLPPALTMVVGHISHGQSGFARLALHNYLEAL